MSPERYRLVGLARPRAVWFRDLSRWATGAALPVEFVKCVAVEELCARLASGRVFSAVIVDGGLADLDRDLVDTAREAGAAVIAVDDGRAARDWRSLGVDAVLPDPLERAALLAALIDRARPLAGPEHSTGLLAPPPPARWQGRLVAVTGPGGAGSSTIAIAVAQGLAARADEASHVVLADLALHADQALLHDAGDVVPGVQELVEAHRTRRLEPAEVHDLTFEVVDRGYRLLLGLRRHRDWAALRPRAVHAALDGLLASFDVVVADVDADLEGDEEVGSIDVEERNLLARAATRRADLVVAVAPASVVGLRRLVIALDELHRSGVEPFRLLPVVVRAPRRTRARAEITAALGELALAGGPALAGVASPVFVPERRHLDEVHRSATPLPRQVVQPVARAVAGLLDRGPLVPAAADAHEPALVAPGSLGSWAHHEEAP